MNMKIKDCRIRIVFALAMLLAVAMVFVPSRINILPSAKVKLFKELFCLVAKLPYLM